VLIQRSADALAGGAWIGVRSTLMPVLANTASNAVANLLSRSRISRRNE